MYSTGPQPARPRAPSPRVIATRAARAEGGREVIEAAGPPTGDGTPSGWTASRLRGRGAVARSRLPGEDLAVGCLPSAVAVEVSEEVGPRRHEAETGAGEHVAELGLPERDGLAGVIGG